MLNFIKNGRISKGFIFFLIALVIIILWFGLRKTREINVCVEREQFKGGRAEIRKTVNKTEIEPGIKVEDLAYHWAPVHYQDINPVGKDRSRPDYITRIDRVFPGKKEGLWDYRLIRRMLSYPLRAYVYYSVVSSETHHFISYFYYHPWDTRVRKIPLAGKIRNNWKKNDLEGVMFIIKRNDGYGILEAVLAQSHGYIHTYLPFTKEDRHHPDYKKYEKIRHWRSSLKINYSSEAMASMGDNVMRVITTQEEGGHGAGCYPDWGAPSCANPRNKKKGAFQHPNPGGGDHIRYIPSRGDAEEPVFSDIYRRKSKYTYTRYRLINVFDPDGGLWFNRYRPYMFTEKPYRFISKHGSPPWMWHGTSDAVFCDNLDLTDHEYERVNKKAHPWSHNPADLAMVYLPVVDDEEYYSNEYVWNNYQDDCLVPEEED